MNSANQITVKMRDGKPRVFDQDGFVVPNVRSVKIFQGVAHVTLVASIDGDFPSIEYDLTEQNAEAKVVK